MRGFVQTIMAVVAVAAFSVSAQQAECKIDPNWNPQKINDTLTACRKVSEQTVAPEVLVANASIYAEVAKGVAEAIGIAARELGVAVDEFIKTDAGKLTVALIVWHVAGDDIKGLVLGPVIIIFAVWLFFTLSKRIRATNEYTTIKTWYGEKLRWHSKPIGDFTEGEGWTYFLSAAFCIILIIIAVVMFF